MCVVCNAGKYYLRATVYYTLLMPYLSLTASCSCWLSWVLLRLRLVQALDTSTGSMSTPHTLRQPQCTASASVTRPSLQPTSNTSAPWNQLGSTT
jgi:hypothetical protein